MLRRAPLPIALSLAAIATVFAAQADRVRIAPAQVKDQVGNVVTVCGTVILSTCQLETNTFLLHLDQADWTRDTGVVFIMPTERRLLPRWDDSFLQRTACGTGKVERRESGYAVRLDDPAQPVLDPLVNNVPAQPAVSNAPAQAPQVFGPNAARCDPRMSIGPRPVSTPGAAYPQAALDAGRCGQISLELVVQPDGSVGDARVVHSIDATPNGLDQAAVAAAKRWRFEPGLRAGQPAAAMVVIQMDFHVKGVC